MASKSDPVFFTIIIGINELKNLGYSSDDIFQFVDPHQCIGLKYEDLRSKILTTYCCCDNEHV